MTDKPIARGRPRGIKPGLKRPHNMTITVSTEERNYIKMKARKNGLNLTDYYLQLIQESEQKEIK